MTSVSSGKLTGAMRTKAVEHVGQTINRLTIVGVRSDGRRVYASCVCACGNKTVQRLDHVLAGGSQSCGCWKNRGNAPWLGSYYQTWRKLVASYGDAVCVEWRGSVATLWRDMGPRPRLHLLRRIDDAKGFEPGNCEWAPKTAPKLTAKQAASLADVSGEASVEEIVERFRVSVGYDALGKSGIYQITNRISGKVYIGSAVNLGARWRCHVNNLVAGNHHSVALQRAWRKYGSCAFVFSVLEECEKDDLIRREQDAINELTEFWGWKQLYNMLRIAGSSYGYKHTPETRRRMAEFQRSRGPRSPEAIRKTADALRGRKRSAATVAKVRAALVARNEADRAEAAARMWATRRERYGKTGREVH